MKAESATPVAVKASGKFVVLWSVSEDGSSTVTKMPCISEEHAENFSSIANIAFGIRSVSNSFTTGLLHKDLEIACGL